MQIPIQANQTEVWIVIISLLTNVVGFVWSAAKISFRLTNLTESNGKLWTKMDHVEKKVNDVEGTVNILWDRSDRRSSPEHERKDD